jgi:hypothetical protein
MAESTVQAERGDGVKEAIAPAQRKGRKKVKEIRITKGEDGGHVVEHHYEQPSHSLSAYHEPKQHVFGASEGDKLLHHVVKKMKIAAPTAYNPPGEGGGEPTGGGEEEE